MSIRPESFRALWRSCLVIWVWCCSRVCPWQHSQASTGGMWATIYILLCIRNCKESSGWEIAYMYRIDIKIDERDLSYRNDRQLKVISTSPLPHGPHRKPGTRSVLPIFPKSFKSIYLYNYSNRMLHCTMTRNPFWKEHGSNIFISGYKYKSSPQRMKKLGYCPAISDSCHTSVMAWKSDEVSTIQL